MAGKLTFQDLILTLQNFWASKGCLILQPYDNEMGAGTFHPATTFARWGRGPGTPPLCSPRAGPRMAAMARIPNRLQHYYQYQVILKPAPANVQDMYLELLRRSAWTPSCTISALSRMTGKAPPWAPAGWAGKCGATGWRSPSSLISSRWAASNAIRSAPKSPMAWSGWPCMSRTSSSFTTSPSTTQFRYGEVFHQNEQEFSAYNFERADTEILFQHFKDAEKQCRELLVAARSCRCPPMTSASRPAMPSICLQARGVISVTERAAYIGRVRALAQACCEAWLETDMGAYMPRFG